jgi:hypothetical protein
VAPHPELVAGWSVSLPFIDQLEALARETGAEFHEVVMLDSKENAPR